MSRQAIFLLATVGLGVAAIVFALKSGIPEEVNDSVPEMSSGAEIAASPLAGEGDLPAAAGDEGVREIVAEKPTSAAGYGLAPESFRRALSVLTGRLVESDGRPAADLDLELFGGRVQDLVPDINSLFENPTPALKVRLGSARSDAEGRFRFEGIFGRTIHLLGIDLGGGRATVRFVDHALNPGETVDLGDIVLDPFVVIVGRVVDLDDQPIAGARVRATNLPPILFRLGAANMRADSSFALRDRRTESLQLLEMPPWAADLYADLPIPETVTAEDGSFRLETLPIGVVTVVVDEDGFVTNVHGPIPSGEGGGTRDVGTIRMDEGDELIGRVIDADDIPQAGAAVRIGPLVPLANVAMLRAFGVTAANGSFRAVGLTDEEHLIAVRPDGTLDWTIVDGIHPGLDEPTIRLAPTHDLIVVAVDEAKNIIPRPELLLRRGFEPAELPVLAPPLRLDERVVYREDGSALVKSLAARKYDLLVRAAGFAASRQDINLTEGPQELRIVLLPERSLAVRVRSLEDGSPVEWARVSALRRGQWTRYRLAPSSSARTDASGVCELTGLKEGTWEIRVSHPDYAVLEVDAEIPTDLFEVQLPRGGAIAGRVHQGGNRLDEARFIVMREQYTFNMRFAVTDINGGFHLERVAPGYQRLDIFPRFTDQPPTRVVEGLVRNLRPERLVPVQVIAGETSRVDIDLLGSGVAGPSATLRGQVLLNGSPAAGFTVSLTPNYTWDQRRNTVTDAAGLFDFGQVPVGTLEVLLVQNSGDSGPNRGIKLSRTIALVENEVRELRFDIRTGRIRGRVVRDVDRVPVAGASVLLYAIERLSDSDAGDSSFYTSATTDADGQFALSGVPAGRYEITVRAAGFASAEDGRVTVPVNGEPPPVEVRLIRGVSVDGVIRFPAGTDLTHLMFYLGRRDRTGSFRPVDLEPDTSRFRIEHVAPGSYHLIMYTGEVFFEPVELEVSKSGIEDLMIEAIPYVEPEKDEDG